MQTLRCARRRQGMTEYVILVGLIALLLIAAVNRFYFSLDEAIEGSAGAMQRLQALQDPASDHATGFSKQVGTLEDGTTKVFMVAEDPSGSGEKEWVYHVGSPTGPRYDADTHGNITFTP